MIAATDSHETARAELEQRQAALAVHDRQTGEVRGRLQALRTEALDLETRLTRLQNEWNEIEARERTDLIRRERFAAEKAEAERAVESYEERLGLMAGQQEQKQAGADEARRQVEDLMQSQAGRTDQLAALQKEISGLDSEAAAREAQVNLLAKSRAESRGFSTGAKKLLENEPVPGVDPKRILGALAEKVRAGKSHRLALEAVLRSWLDAVLVTDAAGALEIARQLQASRGGAVRLLPVAGGSVPIAEGPGVPLLDHVKAPEELAGLLRRLLGGVRVVPAAADVPAVIPDGLTLVTQDGIVARADGSVEFWAPGESDANPLAREHQLAEWTEDLARLRREAADRRARADSLQQDEIAARESLAAAQAALEAHRREMALAEGEIRMVEREAKQARERAETIGWELEALVQKTGAGTQRRADMSGEMESIRTRQAEVRSQNAADTEQLRRLEDERNSLLEAATECRVALSGYKQQVENLRSRGEPLEARLRELETLIRERAAGIDSYQERIAALTTASAEAEGQIAPLEAGLAARQTELQEARAQRESRNAELAKSDADLHARRAELDAVREKRNAVDIQLARQRLHRQNLVERMSADYSLQPADVLKAKPPEWEDGAAPEDREALETLVAEIRTKLQSMGPVNRALKRKKVPMLNGKKIVVVMPAYNAAKTLRKTYDEVMAQGVVDRVIVVDDASRDETAAMARELPNVRVHVHGKNLGYGGNQKTCYRLALEEGADVVIMVHPDYQYTPKLIPAMASLIAGGLYECVLGSRILGGGSLKGGMPKWKYVANRALTFAENLLLGAKLSEYHTGYRAFSRGLLERLPLENNSDDFVFDNEMLAQILWSGVFIAEVSCPTLYFPEASSINFRRSVRYGFGCLRVGLTCRLAKMGLHASPLLAQAPASAVLSGEKS